MTQLRIALALVLAAPLFAQQRPDPNARWVSLGFSKVDPGRLADYVKRVREYTVPLYQAQIEKGTVTSFKLYQVRYPNPNAEGGTYQFVSMIEVPRFQYLDFPAYFLDAKAVLGEAKVAEISKANAAIPSTLVRIQDFRILESTDGWSKADSNVVTVRYVTPNPGMEGDLIKRQRELWKPYYEDAVAAGHSTGWAALEIRFRRSEDRPYQYITMNSHSNFADMHAPLPSALQQKWGEKLRGLNNMSRERKLIREELWQLVASTR